MRLPGNKLTPPKICSTVALMLSAAGRELALCSQTSSRSVPRNLTEGTQDCPKVGRLLLPTPPPSQVVAFFEKR